MQVAYIRKEKCNTTMCNRCVKFCPASIKDMPVIFIGRNKKAIQEYIQNQLQEDYSDDQMSIKEYVDPFTGQPVQGGK